MSEEVKAKTKTELLSEMRELQQSYSKAAAELKQLNTAEDNKAKEERQLGRLADYRTRYNYYAKDDGTTQPIDWEEVEKLLRSSFGSDQGYGLGFDQTGMEGLGCDYGQGGTFTPMVEEERDARIYAEQEKRRKEFKAKQKG